MSVRISIDVSSALPLDMIGEVEPPTQARYDSPLCSVEGCTSRRYPGDGLCCRHQKNRERYGHVETLTEKVLEELREAAHTYGDNQGFQEKCRLVQAALRYAGVRIKSEVERRKVAPLLACLMVDKPEATQLCDAAMRYTNYDPEAPLQGFQAASKGLEDAACAIFRALPVSANNVDRMAA